MDTYAVATKPLTQHYSNIVHTPSEKKKLNTVNKEIVTSYELKTKVSASERMTLSTFASETRCVGFVRV